MTASRFASETSQARDDAESADNRPIFHAEWPGNGPNGPDRGKGAGAFQPPATPHGWNTGGRTSLSANKKFIAGWKTRPPFRETDMTDKALKEILEMIGV
jgi:hypothetical protein